MADNQSNARVKKALQSSKELAKTTREDVAKEKDKILEIIKNSIVDRKIDEKEAKLRSLTEMYDENEVDAINALKSDEVLEKKKLSEEYESIVKKQLQMLQADERGKQALLNEISDIKQQQRKRSEALKARKKTLLVEKERSKRIAALPPPLPRSVKQLLKEQENKDPEAPTHTDSFYYQELSTVEEDFEDKENMDEEEYYEQRRQMQEEWDRKAKKRFNEAIRKDKQKQEHAQILKEIENAEKINRRQMARNLSEPSGKVPCTLSDRLSHVEKQAVLEDAVESAYKKSGTTKEHAIEDLEGYEDKWEAKYQRIDSNVESKMIDCIPNFVKHNYSYLLEEEPAQQCGSRFTRLDDSADDLNVAYIESPTEPVSSSDRITAVITHLDQMMSESNEVYEREFKPLVEAEILKGDQPKLESFDKAVEANILRLPTEDKAIDVREDVSRRSVIPSATRSTQADFMSSGVMAFKRKNLGSKYKSYLGYLSDPHAQSPSWVEPDAAHSNGSWSSSSYMSLPSKHGQPDICKLCDSPSCRLPLVEDKSFHRDCIPLSKNLQKDGQAEIPDSELTPSDVRSSLSSYVQLVADKYLTKTPNKLNSQEQVDASGKDEVHLDTNGTPLRVISGFLSDYSSGGSKELDLKEFPPMPSSDTAIDVTSEMALDKVSQSKSQKLVLPQIPPYSDKKSSNEMGKQDEFVKRCHEILNEKLSDIFSGEDGAESEVLSALKSAISDDASQERKRKLTPGEFVYHELSTILEMDSALTNDVPSLRDMSKRTDVSGSSSMSSLSRMSDGLISPEEVDIVSLVDAPSSEASELAKNIRFVAESSGKPESVPQVLEPITSLSLIYGTLISINTPSPRAVSEAPELAKSIGITTESSRKLPESVLQVLEPTTPIGLVSRMLSNIPTPSPQINIEASTPKSGAITKHLETPSPVTMSDSRSSIGTPSTFKTKSSSSLKDLATPTSQLSMHSLQSEVAQPTHYSSSFRFANLQYPFLTSLTNELPEYFRDVSSIKQGSGNSQDENRSAEKMKPNDDGQTVPKTVYAPSEQRFLPMNFGENFGSDEKSSGTFKPMTPHSYISSPGTNQSDNKSASSKKGNVNRREHNIPISTNELPQSLGSESGYKPITPHSYVSSHKVSSKRKSIGSQRTDDDNYQPMTPHTYVSSNFTSQKHEDLESKREDIGHKTQSMSQIVGRDDDNYQPMTPHTYVSSNFTSQKHEDLESKREDIGHKTQSMSHIVGRDFSVTENSANEYRPMTPQSYISTSNSQFQRQQQLDSEGNNRQGRHSTSQEGGRDRISEQKSKSDFQPMTPHSHISTPNLPSESESSESEYRTFSTSQKMERYFNSANNNASGFHPMTPHYSLSTPNPPPQIHDTVSERKDSEQEMHSISQKEQILIPAKNSATGFQPMTQLSHISNQNLPPQRHDKLSDRKDSRHVMHSTPQREDGLSTHNRTSGSQPMTQLSHISNQDLPPQRHVTLSISDRKDSQHEIHSTAQKEEILLSAQTSAIGFQPMTLHSYLSTPILPSQTHKDFDTEEKYHCSTSVPENAGRYSVATETSIGYQPMTTHSYKSSPDGNTILSSEEDLRVSDRKDSQLNIHSTPQEEERLLSTQNSTSGFQPMAQLSHISNQDLPPQKHDMLSDRKDSQHDIHSTPQKVERLLSTQTSAIGFQPMTLKSFLSTPILPSQTHKDFDTDEKNHRSTSVPESAGRYSVTTETSNGFQPMTSRSYISSPDDNTNLSSEEDLRVHSSSSTSVRLRIPLNLISGTSLESSTSGSEAQLVNDGQNENIIASNEPYKSLMLRFNIKPQKHMNPDADVEDYHLGDGSHLQQEFLVRHPLKNNIYEDIDGKSSRKEGELESEVIEQVKDASNERKYQKALRMSRSDFFTPQFSVADLRIAEDTQSQTLKKPAKVCSSDFFVPQLSSSDFPKLQKGYFGSDLTDCPEITSVESSDLKTCTEPSPSISSVTSSEGKSLANSKKLLRIFTSSSKEGSGSLSPSCSETPYLSVDSSNPILEALRKKFASNPSSKASSLRNTPSCSQETLSDISVSKVNYQSTPVKTIEDIMQETGILEEPDLTLMTTELTIKPESPERMRYFSEKSCAREDILALHIATQNNTDKTASLAKTPSTGATASHAESPSMMSFLQHENSCFGDSKIEACSDLNHNLVNEKLMHVDEYGSSNRNNKFGKKQPKYEYKERTMRLYNNLEEVQKKKMAEEKEKKFKENLMKKKAYSKMYNKPKKTPDH